MSDVKIATREAYGKALAELGDTYDFIVLDADLSEATKTKIFAQKFPERFFDTGIAEGNMMSTAAGLATCGKTVFASSFAMFASGRAFEQIRNSVCYPNLNVKIGGTHGGISVGEDGATHQCNEDIGIMRTIPNMVIINPCDATESKAAVEAAIKHNGPVYLRFCRLATPVIYDNDSLNFEIGKGIVLKDGNDVTIAVNGILVSEALEAAKMLENDKKTGAVVTVEEHNVLGGFGSAVCDVLSEEFPVPVAKIGIEDKFGKSGTPAELFKEYGLTADDIYTKAKKIINNK